MPLMNHNSFKHQILCDPDPVLFYSFIPCQSFRHCAPGVLLSSFTMQLPVSAFSHSLLIIYLFPVSCWLHLSPLIILLFQTFVKNIASELPQESESSSNMASITFIDRYFSFQNRLWAIWWKGYFLLVISLMICSVPGVSQNVKRTW